MTCLSMKEWTTQSFEGTRRSPYIENSSLEQVLIFGARIVLGARDTKPLNFQLLSAAIFLEQKNMMQDFWVLFNMCLFCAKD